MLFILFIFILRYIYAWVFCCQLLGNQLKWSGVVADHPLQELALDGLLNRYILLALQNSAVDAHSIYACQVVSSSYPIVATIKPTVNERLNQ